MSGRANSVKINGTENQILQFFWSSLVTVRSGRLVRAV